MSGWLHPSAKSTQLLIKFKPKTTQETKRVKCILFITSLPKNKHKMVMPQLTEISKPKKHLKFITDVSKQTKTIGGFTG